MAGKSRDARLVTRSLATWSTIVEVVGYSTGHSTTFSTISGSGLYRSVDLAKTVFIALLAGPVSRSVMAPLIACTGGAEHIQISSTSQN